MDKEKEAGKERLDRRPTIAETLRGLNICEWLLYMWSAEDVVRSGKTHDTEWARFMPWWEKEWWDETARKMEAEGIGESGHLAEAERVLAELEDLHDRLSTERGTGDDYKKAYLRAAPAIHQLGGKEGLLRTCFVFLYGLLLLGLQKKEISEDTREAQKTVTEMLSILAGYYKKEKEKEGKEAEE